MRPDDFTFLGELVDRVLGALPAEAWERRTGDRAKDSTLHETVAHLSSVAALFNRAADAALSNKSIAEPGLYQRRDLAAWNTAQIAMAQHWSSTEVLRRLRHELDAAAERQGALTAQTAERRAHLPIYNRPLKALDLLDFQLSHVGVVHAAQVTRPAGLPPLWTHYAADFTERQIDRFMRHFSAAYPPDCAPPDLHAALNFVVDGIGVWHVIASPDGGSAAPGAHAGPAFAFRFADANTLFGISTVELPISDALKLGLLRIDGDSGQALKTLRLFAASPPTTSA